MYGDVGEAPGDTTMRQCSDFEIELSALFDGESDPAMALRLVEHVARCPSCSSFVRDLRSTQDMVDRLNAGAAPQPEAVVVAHSEQQRRYAFGLRPQWALGLAAALVLTVSVWFGSNAVSPASLTNEASHGELVIRLGENKGQMSDERFVALVSELLRADRRYQDQMYLVLDEISHNGASDESRLSDDTHGRGEHRRPERSESDTPLTAAME
jgi:hypothetical protein